MLTTRMDLAMEANALREENAGKTSRLKGVKAKESQWEGFSVHRLAILDQEGSEAVGKPVGTYLTLDIAPYWKREADGFSRVIRAVSRLLAPFLPEEGTVLVAGLGNAAMTPDALGPRTVEQLLITRHLREVLPMLRPVSALAAGVLGTTGIEAAEWIRGTAEHVRPAAVIIVDALAARGLDRLCSTVQISDTGLIPGSGVGNHRMALDRAALGVPVIAVGVPTVVDAATAARDVLTACGGKEEDLPPLQGYGSRYFVTPDSIDLKIRELGKLLGYGIGLALHPQLTEEDLTALLG